jgi:hypothetical protein
MELGGCMMHTVKTDMAAVHMNGRSRLSAACKLTVSNQICFVR